jgi:hypothetical protein
MSTSDELRKDLEAGLRKLVSDRDQLDRDIASVRQALEALDGKPAQFAKASHRSSPKAMKKLS